MFKQRPLIVVYKNEMFVNQLKKLVNQKENSSDNERRRDG